MNPPLHLRTLRREDLDFADTLRSLAGWNQTRADWDRFLALSPTGCFLAERSGRPVGAVTTLRYGSLGWIGMLLVHPDCRRSGVGRALLERGIDDLREAGASCIKLDATPMGCELYRKLGFHDEWELERWESPGNRLIAGRERSARPWRDSDLPGTTALDARVFGASRASLLQALARDSHESAVIQDSEKLLGFGFLRPGSRASYLGPVVAESSAIGLRLVAELLRRSRGARIYWDIPLANGPARAWAAEQGFSVQRRLARMFLGSNESFGGSQQIFAIAGPELG